ncbi:MAG: DMT family transporter [Bacteroidales bacterium]|nr:DMT family transporter [Bacteroidales bacterium]
MPLNKRTETLILLHLAVFLAGWTGIFGRIISLGGLPLVWYRSMVALGVLAAVLALTRRLYRVPLAAVLRIAGCGVLLGIHWVAFYASIKASNVSVGVACIATSCFFTAIFEPLINRHGLSWKDFLISFIAIAGIMLIFSLDVRYRLGIALGLLSAAVYSVFAILNVRVADDSGQDSATMLLYELVGCVVFLALCMPVLVKLNPGTPAVPTRSDFWALLALGSVFTIIPFLLQIHALRHLSPFTVNVAYNLEPVYSILFAAIIFAETREVGPSFWLGISLIVISVVLQSRRTVTPS